MKNRRTLAKIEQTKKIKVLNLSYNKKDEIRAELDQ